MVYSRNIGTLVLSDIKKHQYICPINAPVISLKRHLHALAILVHKFSIFFWALMTCLFDSPVRIFCDCLCGIVEKCGLCVSGDVQPL